MSEIDVLVNETLSMQLDSVSWNKSANLVAVGAYMIDPSNRDRRVGKILLIKLIIKDGDICGHEIVQEVESSGVLDLRWEPVKEKTLIVAASESLLLLNLDSDNAAPALKVVDQLEIPAMALYSQWTSETSLIYSDAAGVVNVVELNPLKVVSSCKLHDSLTWVIQYSGKHNLIFAGCDEGKFTGCLLDSLEDEEKHFKKKFEVGVTSIMFMGENILAVGSYDDTLRLFEITSSDPISLVLKKKIEFGGALWRTLSFPAKHYGQEVEGDDETAPKVFYIVAACARNGIHLVRLDSASWAYETITTCLDYEGFLAYGLDATLEQTQTDNKLTVVSCYFDNNQFHVWKSQFTS